MTTTMTDPVLCVVCDEAISEYEANGLASAMTDHVAECDGHSYTGCKHKGPCWKRTNQADGSQS